MIVFSWRGERRGEGIKKDYYKAGKAILDRCPRTQKDRRAGQWRYQEVPPCIIPEGKEIKSITNSLQLPSNTSDYLRDSLHDPWNYYDLRI
jgi:hypothetical protein